MTLKEESINRAGGCVQMIYEGKIRNHKLRNNSVYHSGEMEEKEVNSFHDYLSTKNCFMVMELKGRGDGDDQYI